MIRFFQGIGWMLFTDKMAWWFLNFLSLVIWWSKQESWIVVLNIVDCKIVQITKYIHHRHKTICKTKILKLRDVISSGWYFYMPCTCLFLPDDPPLMLYCFWRYLKTKNKCRVDLQYSKVKSLCCFVASRINQFGVLELGFMQGWRWGSTAS